MGGSSIHVSSRAPAWALMNPPQIPCALGAASRSPARTASPFPCWSRSKLPSASTSGASHSSNSRVRNFSQLNVLEPYSSVLAAFYVFDQFFNTFMTAIQGQSHGQWMNNKRSARAFPGYLQRYSQEMIDSGLERDLAHTH